MTTKQIPSDVNAESNITCDLPEQELTEHSETNNSVTTTDVTEPNHVVSSDAEDSTPIPETSDETILPNDDDDTHIKRVEISFFDGNIKLSRKKGRKIPASAVPPTMPSNEPEANADVFAPKSLEMTDTGKAPFPGRYDSTMLRIKTSRYPGKRISIAQIRAHIARCKGEIRATLDDRAPCLRNASNVAQNLDVKIVSADRIALYHLLKDDHFMSQFGIRIYPIIAMTTLFIPYGDVSAYYLQFQQPTREEHNVSDVAPVETDEDRIFTIFQKPVLPYVCDGATPDEIRQMHIAHHCDKLTTLFAQWALALPYIDKELRHRHNNMLLSECFVDRFQALLAVHWESAQAQGVTLPDWDLKCRYYLDDIDMMLLWLLISPELSPIAKTALRETWDTMSVVYMSAATLMRFFCTSTQDRSDVLKRLAPSSVMAMTGLFKLQNSSNPTQPLYFEIIISEQITRQFAGIESLSLPTTQYAELFFPHFSEDTYIAESHLKTFRIIQNYLTRPSLNLCKNLERENLDFVPSMAFLVEGLPGSGRMTMIKIMASRMKRPVIVVQSNPIANIHPTDAEEYLKMLFIDASLMNAILCFRDAASLVTEEKLASILARQLAQRPVVCALCVELAAKTAPTIDPYITFKTKMDGNLKDTAAEYWKPHLNLPHLENAQIDVVSLSQRMALQPFQIQKAAKLAYYSADLESDNNASHAVIENLTQNAKELAISNRELEKAAAVQVTKNIGNLAFVTDPEIDLSDVVVSNDIMEKIQQIIGSARNRRRVLYEWGLCKRIRRGTGVIALFDGDPGTGKTHSAEAIAHELGLSLMRVNIASMVDKYIGETEKNLTMIFEQARPDMQLLLFDEADSLFTKRTTNVSKSNDRYSNMSVNVLLQLVERYEGVSILTTNLKNAIDPAFERRITYKVYFPMPKQPERERLWKYMCPPDILTAEPIDYEWLSELEMSGGEIKNAVLTAAFTAATYGKLLDSEILYNAAVAEASAAGRVMRRYEGNDFMS